MEFEIVMRDLRDLIFLDDPQEIEKEIGKIQASRAKMTAAADHYKTTLVDENDKKVFEDFLEARKAIAVEIDKIYTLAKINKALYRLR
jgi:hypothetical protein